MTSVVIPDVSIPGLPDDVAVTILGDYIAFVRISHDEFAENPCEMDGVGQIHSLIRRHTNHMDVEQAREILRTDLDAVALSYFEHGNCMWFVQHSGPQMPDFQWDGTHFAGIWVPDDCVRESYLGQDGLTRRQWMEQQARHACDTFTEWCNGEVYGYDVQVYKLRHDDAGAPYDELSDYRRQEPVADDSLWGMYDFEYCAKEARAVVEDAIKTVSGYQRGKGV